MTTVWWHGGLMKIMQSFFQSEILPENEQDSNLIQAWVCSMNMWEDKHDTKAPHTSSYLLYFFFPNNCCKRTNSEKKMHIFTTSLICRNMAIQLRI